MRQSDLDREAKSQIMRDQVDKMCKIDHRRDDMS